MATQTSEKHELLNLFLSATKRECPLCGSREWRSPTVVTVDRKDMGGVYQHITARSPCSHTMTFSEQMLRDSPRQQRKLLRTVN
jgi:hypothetical protein